MMKTTLASFTVAIVLVLLIESSNGCGYRNEKCCHTVHPPFYWGPHTREVQVYGEGTCKGGPDCKCVDSNTHLADIPKGNCNENCLTRVQCAMKRGNAVLKQLKFGKAKRINNLTQK